MRFFLKTNTRNFQLLIFHAFIFFVDSNAQINAPKKPEFNQPDPSKTAGIESFHLNKQTYYYINTTPIYKSPIGATAEQILEQAYNTHPIYIPPNGSIMDIEANQKATNAYILNQMKQDPMYNVSANSLKRHRELLSIINEANAEQSAFPVKQNYSSAEFIAKTKSYQTAFENLQAMMTDKKSLSIKDAYFEMEKAYGGSYLNKTEYDAIIKEGGCIHQEMACTKQV
jgi:hypothetical protein